MNRDGAAGYRSRLGGVVLRLIHKNGKAPPLESEITSALISGMAEFRYGGNLRAPAIHYMGEIMELLPDACSAAELLHFLAYKSERNHF